MTGALGRARDLLPAGGVSADVVVAGGGAGGAMAARELARRGLDVVLFEEGPDHPPARFSQREDEMIPELFHELGGRRTEDLSITILSGRGLGGSTIHNTNLAKRADSRVVAHWRDGLGLEELTDAALAPLFDEVERDLGVRAIPDAQGNTHNRVFRRGVERLGLRGAGLAHNRDERCVGSGFCELGCAYDAKLNARRVLVPQAVAAGARVLTEARVERVRVSGLRATGVEVAVLASEGRVGRTERVACRAVCLAGSAIGSAALALRSGFPDPHGRLGRGLRIHPASLVAGRFDERIEGWRGIPQSYECTEFLDLAPGAARRVWILPSFAHPVGAAAMMTGFGPPLLEGLRAYPHLAVLTAMVHDETEGRVYLDGARTRIAYVPTAGDRAQLALGAREAGRILLAAGAKEVIVPAAPRIVVRSERELTQITGDRFAPCDGKVAAVHPMGTLAMAARPEDGAADARGRVFGVQGVYVVDGSLFPTSLGGPPQISIFAFAMRVARLAADDLARGRPQPPTAP